MLKKEEGQKCNCPTCGKEVDLVDINAHLDSHFEVPATSSPSKQVSPFFQKEKNSPLKRNTPSSFPSQGSFTPSSTKKPRASKRDVRPLAERARPTTLDDYVGQEELVGPRGVIRNMIEQDECPSMILWGNSGTGKTTLARIIAATTKSRFLEVSATSISVQECRKIFEESQNHLRLTGSKTIVFLDEVHRFNRAQQDIFLPLVEKGSITLIGATTENPSFRLNSALISRCPVFVLKKLDKTHVLKILEHGCQLEKDRLGDIPNIDSSILEYVSAITDGDARMALNCLEMAIGLMRQGPITLEEIKEKLVRSSAVYDRVGDAHYDTISAFHKSVRGCDVNASLYYLGRMLESGEDPLYVARRMVRIASEDIGVADNSMLPLASSAFTSVQQVGMPEADVILAHCAVALTMAPKSVDVYKGYNNVKRFLSLNPNAGRAEIPLHIRNAPTNLMKQLGYHKGYKYNPDYKDGLVKQEYMPESIRDAKFFRLPAELLEDEDLEK
ncbi:DNA replication ATPase [Schizosaccharomyces cryophilus OY26]|uniref:DNA replication ATPase n=1 Tax=Schizosaccharomyces cryophilus (strain OY26 / ATCC MYA-4695 / CBS 11777 / NBRC 106824 / NRRL Y48691) TaxID=653667 RepID=S9X2W8_SCHCR|nr:DNA replication ATPase [Schizosaccharomyces cryophilus OY26]EPY51437.1 DNA replication ATPase [Schizosaccharomyces cryophilus OY26]